MRISGSKGTNRLTCPQVTGQASDVVIGNYHSIAKLTTDAESGSFGLLRPPQVAIYDSTRIFSHDLLVDAQLSSPAFEPDGSFGNGIQQLTQKVDKFGGFEGFLQKIRALKHFLILVQGFPRISAHKNSPQARLILLQLGRQLGTRQAMGHDDIG